MEWYRLKFEIQHHGIKTTSLECDTLFFQDCFFATDIFWKIDIVYWIADPKTATTKNEIVGQLTISKDPQSRTNNDGKIDEASEKNVFVSLQHLFSINFHLNLHSLSGI